MSIKLVCDEPVDSLIIGAERYSRFRMPSDGMFSFQTILFFNALIAEAFVAIFAMLVVFSQEWESIEGRVPVALLKFPGHRGRLAQERCDRVR